MYDELFTDVLNYVDCMLNNHDYLTILKKKERYYYPLFEKGSYLLQDQISNISCFTELENERLFLLSNSQNESIHFELSLIVYAFFCIKTNQLFELSDLISEYASSEFIQKYSRLLNLLNCTKKADTYQAQIRLNDSCYESKETKESLFQSLVTMLVSQNNHFLIRNQLYIIRNMINSNLSDNIIKESLNINDSFLFFAKKFCNAELDLVETINLIVSSNYALYADLKYDCSDFDLAILSQTAYSYQDLFSKKYENKFIQLIRNFESDSASLDKMEFDPFYLEYVLDKLKKNPTLSADDILPLKCIY